MINLDNPDKPHDLIMQEVGSLVANFLEEKTGQSVGFVLLLTVDLTAHYVSNLSRDDGQGLMRDLLANAEKALNEAPTYYN